MRYLLENRVVSAGMLSQSLLETFVENKDWVRVSLFYARVVTILSPLRSCFRSAQSR